MDNESYPQSFQRAGMPIADATQARQRQAETLGGGGYAGPKDRDKGSLEREIDALGNNLDTFDRLLQNLLQRVNPISRPGQPAGNGNGKAIPTPATPIASYLQAQNQRFEALLEALGIITDRIDL